MCADHASVCVDMYQARSNSRSLLDMCVVHSLHISLNSKDIFYEGGILNAGKERRSLHRTAFGGCSIIWKIIK